MYYFFTKYIIYRCGLLFFLLIVSCAQLPVKDGDFSPSHKKYSVTLPAKGWESIKVGKEDIAIWNGQSRATIAFISSVIQGKKSSLEMLRRQLFIGMKSNKILLSEPVLVGNQAAMHTILSCNIDNHNIKIESYVIRLGNSVYDLAYWAPCDSFDNAREDFVGAINSFKSSTPIETQHR